MPVGIFLFIDFLRSSNFELGKKGSYLKKYLSRQNEGEPPARSPRVMISLPEAARKIFEEGKLLLIDKPIHWTSFDVVRKIRGMIRIKKVGHAGTLDPLATGLLIICTGKQTKQITDYMARPKTYTGTITLGATTPTYDLESVPENELPFEHIDISRVKEEAKNFLGQQMQMPPVYAAIKKEGVALYELARRGKEVELEPRPIEIYEFEITSFHPPDIGFQIRCSTGTYIRSIAHDFGKVLGCGAYLSELRRTAIGDFKVEDAMGINQFTSWMQQLEKEYGSGQDGI